MSLNDVLKTRSLSPLAARVCKILKSWCWKIAFDAGLITSVSAAVARATTTPAISTGRNSRRGPTPAALNATTSRSPASRPPARRIATSRAIGSVCARNEGSM